MKLKINILFLLTLILFESSVFAFSPHLVLDADNQYQLPKNFRITSDKNNLHLMGSGQFSENNFNYVLTHHPKPTYLFDLRQESHGFLNGMAISWYGKNNWANVKKTPFQVEKIENILLTRLKNQFIEVVFKTKPNKDPMEIHPSTVFNEQQFITKNNINYIRIPVTDHRRPSDQQVDHFVNIIKQIPQSDWLYFHCRGGKGRTTSFMAMVDMMRNAKKESVETILKRHQELGGSNFYKEGKTKQLNRYANERVQFLQKFYRYAQQNEDGFRTSWLEWNK